jgi:hypothetical protein
LLLLLLLLLLLSLQAGDTEGTEKINTEETG